MLKRVIKVSADSYRRLEEKRDVEALRNLDAALRKIAGWPVETEEVKAVSE